ncbi:MAG TPA: cystathionine beta-synthase [Candidatus Nitrosotenuis sp.]|nr:cystathionine beta-synthase [Candidatus Nitrosotenuis sp.]
MRYAQNILELIGNTPLVRLSRIAAGVRPLILAKLEILNPGGSVKDRIGVRMIEEAERSGKLRKGGVIIEPTSGNTGVGLAQAAALKGYRCIFVMPDKMSQEKIRLLKAYGAEVVITPTNVPKESPESYYSVADRLTREIPNAFQPNQYANPVNPQTHYETTGPEIWEQTEGKIDVFVAGMGTGGTITGVARYLKEQKPSVQIVGVDPEGSLYTSNEVRPYKIEGIGEDFIPATIDLSLVDHLITVSDRDAFVTARHLAREEGILAGGSAGAAVYGALKFARRLDEKHTVVVLLPDTGRNYLSKFFSDEYMKEHGFWDPGSEAGSLKDVLDSKVGGPSEVITVNAGDPVRQAIEIMRRYSVSQLPVMENGDVVGTVQETQLMNLIFEDASLLGETVQAVMSDPLPVLPLETPIPSVYQVLLEGRSAVMVADPQQHLVGILTKIDLIDYFSRRARH